MTLTNTKVMTSSGTIILYVKHGTVININKSVNYFKQKYQVSYPFAIPFCDASNACQKFCDLNVRRGDENVTAGTSIIYMR